MMGCKSKIAITDDGYISNQIELDLVDTMSPSRITDGFSKFNIELLCHLDREANIGVYSFDAEIISLDQMLLFFDGEVGVEGVQKTDGCKPKKLQ